LRIVEPRSVEKTPFSVKEQGNNRENSPISAPILQPPSGISLREQSFARKAPIAEQGISPTENRELPDGKQGNAKLKTGNPAAEITETSERPSGGKPGELPRPGLDQ
jgi:hypothetical protein